MAWTRERENGRFTGMYYTPAGDRRVAGTFDTEERALEVAKAQEEFLRRGARGVSPAEKATMTLDDYFPLWLKSHPVELSTKAGYRDTYECYIKRVLGKERVAEVESDSIAALLWDLRERGLSPSTQKAVRSLLSGMMRMAVRSKYRADNPAAGLSVQRKSRKGSRKIKVLTVDQFQALYGAFPSAGARLLAMVLINTGCRPSVGLVLTPNDFDAEARTISFNKALQTIDREDSQDGLTTHIVGPTKTGEERTLKVPPYVIAGLLKWIAEHNIGPDDLIFPRDLTLPRQRATSIRRQNIVLTPELVATLGTITAPNGREYQHGTWQAYVTAKCRGCVYCRQAFSDYRYDLERRKGTTGHSYGTTVQPSTDRPYIDTVMWRRRFKQACEDAGLPFIPTAYQLRHTHASWLIRQGEDPKTVMTRLGHASLRTTEYYVEVVDDGQSSADIMASLDIDWDVA